MRQIVLSGCRASAPPKTFRPRTDGAWYTIQISLPLIVTEVSFGGLWSFGVLNLFLSVWLSNAEVTSRVIATIRLTFVLAPYAKISATRTENPGRRVGHSSRSSASRIRAFLEDSYT